VLDVVLGVPALLMTADGESTALNGPVLLEGLALGPDRPE
jgi:hypothetical protein